VATRGRAAADRRAGLADDIHFPRFRLNPIGPGILALRGRVWVGTVIGFLWVGAIWFARLRRDRTTGAFNVLSYRAGSNCEVLPEMMNATDALEDDRVGWCAVRVDAVSFSLPVCCCSNDGPVRYRTTYVLHRMMETRSC